MRASSAPLPSVGRALARIASLRGPRASEPVPGGNSRAAVLEFIERADDAVRVDEIAPAVGLHPNTVRGHLDALLAAGRVTRVPDQRATPGRPHWLYSATNSAPERELAHALEAELRRSSAPEVARRAAAIWADAGPDVLPADSPDSAVDRATEALTTLGFDAVRNPVGDAITLRVCPYADLVRDQPVICDIHAELLGAVLGRTRQPVALDRLDVHPRPGLCVAHLRRPDAGPERVVPATEAAPTTATPAVPSRARDDTQRPPSRRKVS